MVRREQRALRLEVRLHRPVVVEVVVAQIGEDGHVEMDALHPGLDQRMAGHLHGHGVTTAVGELAIAHLGQHALHLGRLRRGADAREGAHHVGRSAGGLEEVPEQLGHRGLAVRPGDADHQEVAGREPVEGGGQAGHDRADGARGDERLDHGSIEQLGDEVLAQQPDRAAVHGLGGEGVAVAEVARARSRTGPRARPGGCRGRCHGHPPWQGPRLVSMTSMSSKRRFICTVRTVAARSPARQGGHGSSAPPASAR